MSKERRTRRLFSILNVLIVILTIVLAVSILITIHMLRDESILYYDKENSLYSYLSDGEYSALIDRYYENGIGKETDPRTRKAAEYYAVGRYFEKAFFANAFEKAGNMEKADRCRQQMEELETEMGQFSAEKKEILKLFPDLKGQ